MKTGEKIIMASGAFGIVALGKFFCDGMDFKYLE